MFIGNNFDNLILLMVDDLEKYIKCELCAYELRNDQSFEIYGDLSLWPALCELL